MKTFRIYSHVSRDGRHASAKEVAPGWIKVTRWRNAPELEGEATAVGVAPRGAYAATGDREGRVTLVEATAATCFGPGVRSLAVYLMARQHLPVERTAELMRDRVVPIRAANVSWLILGMTGSSFPSLPKLARSMSNRASRFSPELNR